MSKREQRAPAKARAARTTLAAFALLFFAGQAREARAQQWETTGSDIRSTNTGAVGIGLAAAESPAAYYKLDVRGLGIFGLTRKISLNADFGGNGEWPAGAAVTSIGNNSMFMAASPDLGSAGAKAGLAYYNGAGWFTAAEVANVAGGGATRSSLLLMRGGGKVGIGTASPGNKLTISSASGEADTLPAPGANGGKFALLNNGGLYGQLFGVLSNGDSFIQSQRVDGAGTTYHLLLQPNGGRVGVGTTAPLGSLHVPDGYVIIGQNYYGGANLRVGRFDATYSGIVSATNFNDGAKPIYRARSNAAAGLSGDGLYTFLAQNDGMVRTFSADHQGNGYFAGGLSVAGTITGGAIEARYQDVAEWVPSTQELASGTVVVLDPERTNHVLASASAYDTSVAGVVSEQPGIILGVGGEGKVKVATTGRVRVKVDATRGPIRIGDLLVTSDVPGVAMRSEPLAVGGRRLHAPGTIIGKALEPLAGGAGEILVLLSMQ